MRHRECAESAGTAFHLVGSMSAAALHLVGGMSAAALHGAYCADCGARNGDIPQLPSTARHNSSERSREQRRAAVAKAPAQHAAEKNDCAPGD